MVADGRRDDAEPAGGTGQATGGGDLGQNHEPLRQVWRHYSV